MISGSIDDEAPLLPRDQQSLHRTPARRRRRDTGVVFQRGRANFDAAGHVVGLDINHASRYLDLTKLETVSLPLDAA